MKNSHMTTTVYKDPRVCKGNKYLASLLPRQDVPGASVSFKSNIQIFHMVQECLFVWEEELGESRRLLPSVSSVESHTLALSVNIVWLRFPSVFWE